MSPRRAGNVDLPPAMALFIPARMVRRARKPRCVTRGQPPWLSTIMNCATGSRSAFGTTPADSSRTLRRRINAMARRRRSRAAAAPAVSLTNWTAICCPHCSLILDYRYSGGHLVCPDGHGDLGLLGDGVGGAAGRGTDAQRAVAIGTPPAYDICCRQTGRALASGQ